LVNVQKNQLGGLKCRFVVGENVPPCPIDPTTGLPDLDAWGALLELAINVACKE